MHYKKKRMKFRYIYTTILIAELIVITFNWHTAEYFTKPALVIALLIYFLSTKKSFKSDKQNQTMLVALIFCLAGDIILLFDKGFIFGLAAFLIGHIFYILTFIKDNDGFHLKKNRMSYLLLGAIFAGLLALFILIPHVDGALKIPIFIYTVTILTMLVTVFNRFKPSVSKTSYNLVLIGAVLFIISDFCLAFNQFVQSLPDAHFIVMLTYGVAQYFIFTGFTVES